MIPIDRAKCLKLFEWIEQHVNETQVPTSDPTGKWVREEVSIKGLDFLSGRHSFGDSTTSRSVLGKRIVHWLRQLAYVSDYTGIDSSRLQIVTQRAWKQRTQVVDLFCQAEEEEMALVFQSTKGFDHIECLIREQLCKHPTVTVSVIACLASQVSFDAFKWIGLLTSLRGLSIWAHMRSSNPLGHRSHLVFPSGIVAPLVEEVAYRGLLQTALLVGLTLFLTQFVAATVSIITSSALFGVSHREQGPIAICASTITGLAYGIFAHNYGLGASVLAHSLYNLGVLLEPKIVDYLKQPQEKGELIAKFAQMGHTARG